MRQGYAIPFGVQRRSVGTRAGIREENPSAGIQYEIVLVGMAVAAAVRSVLEAQPGRLHSVAALQNGIARIDGVAAAESCGSIGRQRIDAEPQGIFVIAIFAGKSRQIDWIVIPRVG